MAVKRQKTVRPGARKLPDLRAAAVSDRGLNPRRSVNQDRYLMMPEAALFAVFDGVGGHKGGEVASQTAADTIEEAIASAAAAPALDLINRAVQFANRDIYELAAEDSDFNTMATTVALIQFDGARAAVAHVGDSRIYRLSAEGLIRETTDHTEIEDQVRAGIISRDQADALPESHVINRALGVEPRVEVEVNTIAVSQGDVFLICTDGVYRLLSDEELAGILRDQSDPQQAAEEIKRRVHERGADDNLTAIVIHIGRAPANPSHAPATGPEPKRADTQSAERDDDGCANSVPDKTALSLASGPAAPGQAGGEGEDRIRVDIGTRGPQHGGKADPPHSRGTRIGSRLDQISSRSTAILVVLVLVLAAFYAGLRVSDWVGKSSSRPRATETPLAAGRAAYDRGDYQGAARAFSVLATAEPGSAEARYWLGRSELAQRDFTAAARDLEASTSLAPDLADGYLQAATAYEALGSHGKAAEMLAKYGEVLKRTK